MIGTTLRFHNLSESGPVRLKVRPLKNLKDAAL
jgi:hypothetical protein